MKDSIYNDKEKKSVRETYTNYNEYSNKEFVFCGWVRNIRNSKTISFIELNDGTYLKSAQVVVECEKVDNYKEVCSINVGASIAVVGEVKVTPQAKQPFEIIHYKVKDILWNF